MKIPTGGESNAKQPSRFELTEENVANALDVAKRSTPGLRWGPSPFEAGDQERLLMKGSGPVFCAWTGPKEDEVYAALTGNGPTSEVNALFYAHARDIVIALIEERTRLRAGLESLVQRRPRPSHPEAQEIAESLVDAVRDLLATQATHASPADPLRFGTSFELGRDGDDDRRPYVLVARQYGSASFPIPPWAVHDVYDRGVDNDSKVTFDNQAEALAYGWKRLEGLRG